MWRSKESILNADPRFATVVRCHTEGWGLRQITIEDLYDQVDPLTLPVSVPAEIRQQFDLARNAFLYSWFDYEMASLAEQHSYTVLEMALKYRAKLSDTESTSLRGLKNRLNRALELGWLNKEDFEFVVYDQRHSRLDSVVRMRNDLMHGNPHLMPGGSVTMMELVFEIIEKLFPREDGMNQ